jgi:hypothetical protein
MHSQRTSYRSVINFKDVPNKAKRDTWAKQSYLLAASDVKLLAGREAMATFGFAVLRSMAANIQIVVPPTRYNMTPEVLTTSGSRGN